jgi:hypothetical protein
VTPAVRRFVDVAAAVAAIPLAIDACAKLLDPDVDVEGLVRAAGEIGGAALLAAPRKSKTSGAALVAFATGLLFVRVVRGDSCGCLATFAAPSAVLWAYWAALALLGVLFLRFGRRAAGARAIVEACFGACSIVIGAALATAPVDGGGPIRVAFEARAANDPPGTRRLSISNQGRGELRSLRAFASCECLAVAETPERIERGGIGAARVSYVRRRPAGVRPFVAIVGEIDGRSYRAEARAPDDL